MIFRRLELVTGDGLTYGDQLQRVAKELLGDKFVGIFTEADMPIKLAIGQGAIINKPINRHWIAQYRDRGNPRNPRGHLHTYDSFGRKMGPGAVAVPSSFKQGIDESDCGPRSLAWLYDALN